MSAVIYDSYHPVEHDIRGLDRSAVRIKEDGAEKADFFDGVRTLFKIDPVPDVKGVLDKQKDDARKNFLQAPTNEPA